MNTQWITPDNPLEFIRKMHQETVIQCQSCREYLLEDAVMKQVESILDHAGKSIEFEVVRFAA